MKCFYASGLKKEEKIKPLERAVLFFAAVTAFIMQQLPAAREMLRAVFH